MMQFELPQEESSIIKNIIFIMGRLHQQHVELPEDTLSYFAKFIADRDITIQRLALNLYKKLSLKLPIDNMMKKLEMFE